MENKKQKKRRKIRHFYNKKDIKKDYKFWNSQLVPQFNNKLYIELGPIKTDFTDKDIITPQISLPGEMKWVDMDITKENDLEKIYEFLYLNYIETEDYKEYYIKSF